MLTSFCTGLEEVAIDARELGIGGLGGEAIIADELADDGAVLLFNMGAVVLEPIVTMAARRLRSGVAW